MSNIAIICIVLASLLVLICFIVFLLFLKKLKKYNKQEKQNNAKHNSFNKYSNISKKELQRYNDLNAELKRQIIVLKETLKKNDSAIYEKMLSNEKNILNKLYENEKQNYIKEFKSMTEESKKECSKNILLEAIEKMSKVELLEKYAKVIDFEDKTLIPKIIGKRGRSIDKFKNVTECDLILDTKNNTVVISSYNEIRRIKGIETFNRMVRSDAFGEETIENIYNKISSMIEQRFIKMGENACKEVGINAINKAVYSYVGMLAYRYSYGQNVLVHCKEASLCARSIAKSIGADEQLAAEAAFFHDIGKSYDQTNESFDHIKTGLEIATTCNLGPHVVDAIKEHHSYCHDNIYSVIAKIADTMSAGRKAARDLSNDDIWKRAAELEKVCMEFDDVLSCYVLKGGRELNVIVKPTKIMSVEALEELANRIEIEIQKNEEVGDQKIEIKCMYNLTFKKNT